MLLAWALAVNEDPAWSMGCLRGGSEVRQGMLSLRGLWVVKTRGVGGYDLGNRAPQDLREPLRC